MSQYRRITLLLMLFISISAQAADPPLQSHAGIVQAAENHLRQTFANQGDQLSIKISPLDHRLRLARCDGPLETFDPPGGTRLGRTTVGVRCPQPKPWTLYVSAKVGLELPVVVATRDLGRDTPIEPGDLRLQRMDTAHLLRGHFTRLEEVVGQRLKRTLRRGQAVTPSILVEQKSVRRGEQIVIVSALGSIEVRSRGKALRDGNPGDLIPVENLSSKKRLQGRVISTGLVSIN